jgi:general secretion pathway protein N
VAVVAAPPTPLPPTPQRVAPDRPPLSLIGTISGSPDGIGVFIEETTSRSIRIKTSQAYAGWTLVAVTRREATFQIGDRQATLTFPLPGQDRPRPAPPPAQAASDAQGAQ